MQKIRELTVALPADQTVTARVYEPLEPLEPLEHGTVILAHGAGAGHDSPFMIAFATALAGLGVNTVTFNFLYTEQRRRVPDRLPVLVTCYRSVIDAVRRDRESRDAVTHDVPAAQRALFIGGKSMGGRVATHVATDPQLGLAGVVLLGYPLHPPGRLDQRRDAHLGDVVPPLLFIQGSRDTFGTPAELQPVMSALGDRATLHVVEGGDHSFKVARAGRDGQAQIHAAVQRVIVEWMASQQRARG